VPAPGDPAAPGASPAPSRPVGGTGRTATRGDPRDRPGCARRNRRGDRPDRHRVPRGRPRGATATAPRTSGDSTDAVGRTTTYAAANLLDGNTGTAWRMEGDGTGTTLRFTFGQVQQITEVGLVNGVAKVDPHDGADPVTQRLVDGTRDLQLLAVPPVSAREVTLTIGEATRSGGGSRYDRTALSEVRFAQR